MSVYTLLIEDDIDHKGRKDSRWTWYLVEAEDGAEARDAATTYHWKRYRRGNEYYVHLVDRVTHGSMFGGVYEKKLPVYIVAKEVER